MKDYQILWKRIFHPQRPEIMYVDKLPEKLDPPENAVAMYYPIENRIYILSKHKRNVAIKIHEYGHWFFVALYYCLDELWEVLWWWTGLRKLFVKSKWGGNEKA